MDQNNFRAALDFLKNISDDQKVFRRLNLAGTTLEKFRAPKGCSFVEMNFQNCQMPWAVLINCRLKNSLFNHTNLMGSIIAGSDCEGTSFEQTNLNRVNFFKSKLTKAIFRNANLEGVNFKEANLRGADLRDAALDKVLFTNAIFDDRTLFDPHINPETLGLRWVDVIQEDEASGFIPAPNQKPTLRYRGALIDKEAPVTTKQPKTGLRYRGAPIDDEPDNKMEPPTPKKEVKRFYRGVRIS